jgi:glycosyltransferase involved in cell wall biosynthesis
VRAQTYRNIETIVVNDGTDPIADLFAEADDLRLIDNPVNLGLGGTRNAGAVHARGTYVAFLDDDDEFFPDHIARLVAALERTGFDLANAASLTRFARVDETGTYRLAGYSVESMRTYAFNELLVTNASTPVTLMFRRTAFERAGGFDEGRTGLEDYMLCLAVARTADVTSVQRVTAIYARRDDGSNMIVYTGARHADYLEAIYARHPVPARELVNDLRRQTIEVVRRNGGPQVPKPPLALDAPFPPPMNPRDAAS